MCCVAAHSLRGSRTPCSVSQMTGGEWVVTSLPHEPIRSPTLKIVLHQSAFARVGGCPRNTPSGVVLMLLPCVHMGTPVGFRFRRPLGLHSAVPCKTWTETIVPASTLPLPSHRCTPLPYAWNCLGSFPIQYPLLWCSTEDGRSIQVARGVLCG